MGSPRTHFREVTGDPETIFKLGICGHMPTDPKYFTNDMGQTTCKLCLKLLEHAVKVPAVPAEVIYPYPVPASRYTTAGIRTALEVRAEFRGERPQWSTWQSFLDSYIRLVDDGAGLKSTSNPNRFEGHSPSFEVPSGDQAQRAAGEYAFAVKILETAFTDGLKLSDVPCRVLTQMQCHLLLEQRVAGRRIAPTRKGGVWTRVPWQLRELAETASKQVGFDVSAGDVHRVFIEGGRQIEELLLARRLISHRDARLREAEVTINKPWDLEGLKEIAGLLGCSADTITRWSEMEDDPFPLRRFMGRIVASRAEVEAWVKRQHKVA